MSESKKSSAVKQGLYKQTRTHNVSLCIGVYDGVRTVPGGIEVLTMSFPKHWDLS